MVTRQARAARERRAAEIAAGVTDPELPMLTLADLGILRDVAVANVSECESGDGGEGGEGDDGGGGTVLVSITPTYSGCPALETMRADLRRELHAAGFERVEVRTVLSPPWSSDRITERGRRKLAEHGISPPGAAPRRSGGPVPLDLAPTKRSVPCPQCGSGDTEELSRFGATSCKALLRCRSCKEPFEHVKEI